MSNYSFKFKNTKYSDLKKNENIKNIARAFTMVITVDNCGNVSSQSMKMVPTCNAALFYMRKSGVLYDSIILLPTGKCAMMSRSAP